MYQYEFSHEPQGPFVKFKTYETPQAALNQARNIYTGTVYVARCRRLGLADIFDPADVALAIGMERLSERYGVSVVTQMEESNSAAIHDHYDRMINSDSFSMPEAIYVPVSVVECPKEKQTIDASEFVDGRFAKRRQENAKPKLKDLL